MYNSIKQIQTNKPTRILQEISADYQDKTIDNIIQKMGQGLTK